MARRDQDVHFLASKEEVQLLRSAFDQIPNEKKTAAFCAAAAAWKAAVRQLRCHGSVGNRSEQP